jgi:ACR3 family arsenite efflux pump ArsB
MQLCTKMSAVVANLSDVAGSDVMVQVLLASILFVVVPIVLGWFIVSMDTNPGLRMLIQQQRDPEV